MNADLEDGGKWARVWVDATHNELVIQRGFGSQSVIRAEQRQGGIQTEFGTPDLDYLGQLKQRALRDLRSEGFHVPQSTMRFYG